MKSKLLIIAAFCSITLTVNAQTEKGKNFISGSFGYKSTQSGNGLNNGNTISNYGDTTKIFNVMPRFGHFISKNLAIGMGIGYINNKTSVNSTSTTTSTIAYSNQTAKQNSFNLGPFLRYYVDITENFKFFGQLNTSIGFGKGDHSASFIYYNLGASSSPISYGSSKSSYKFTSYGGSINPGFAFFPSKKWAIEFSFPLIDYNKLKPKDQDPSTLGIQTVENFNFATDSFNPSIGFNFHF